MSVNTCRLIDDTVKESLDTTGDARSENAKFIGTGCLGARTAAKGATETEAAQASLEGESAYFFHKIRNKLIMWHSLRPCGRFEHTACAKKPLAGFL